MCGLTKWRLVAVLLVSIFNTNKEKPKKPCKNKVNGKGSIGSFLNGRYISTMLTKKKENCVEAPVGAFFYEASVPKNNYGTLIKALEKKCSFKYIKKLIADGADVKELSRDGDNAIGLAIENNLNETANLKEIICDLVAAGAKVNHLKACKVNGESLPLSILDRVILKRDAADRPRKDLVFATKAMKDDYRRTNKAEEYNQYSFVKYSCDFLIKTLKENGAKTKEEILPQSTTKHRMNNSSPNILVKELG